MSSEIRLRHVLINGDCRMMDLLMDGSVHLIVTSPPYWQLKDYGVKEQIGYNDSYEEYINNLNLVWTECFRVLKSGCRLCINIGDQFARSAYYGRYKVIPIHSEIIRFCEAIGFDYMGNIIWQKQTSMHTSGGGKVMGSYPYPRGGIVKIDYENILIFKKPGKCGAKNNEARLQSQLTDENWNTYFNSHWIFPGDTQNKHIAVFPEELPARLIKMFSFKDDTVLDPFMGSGTTALAALKNGRNAIGFELNEKFFSYYRNKVLSIFPEDSINFEYNKTDITLDISSLLSKLPYLFKDPVKLKRNEEAAKKTYGSIIRDEKLHNDLDALAGSKAEETLDNGSTVLVNHVDHNTRKTMIENGVCYLRIGNIKGSLTITPEFARLSHLLLHYRGENPKMFKLKQKGSFQIWNRETLEALGFHPASAPYYAVIRFESNKEIKIRKLPNLKLRKATYLAKLMPYSAFI